MKTFLKSVGWIIAAVVMLLVAVAIERKLARDYTNADNHEARLKEVEQKVQLLLDEKKNR